MSVTVSCDRVACGATEEIDYFYSSGLEGDEVFARIIMPDGWAIDRVGPGHDRVVHCPEHAEVGR